LNLSLKFQNTFFNKNDIFYPGPQYICLYILEDKMTELRRIQNRTEVRKSNIHFLRRRLFICGGDDKAEDLIVLWRKQADGQWTALLQEIHDTFIFYILTYLIISLWILSCYLSVCPSTLKEISKIADIL